MIYILIVIIIAGSEYLIKNYVEAQFRPGDRREILGGRIVLNKEYNKGAFLNLFEKKKEIVKTVSGIFLGLLLLLFALLIPKKGSKLFKLGLSLALGGAISNVSDRFLRGYVVDYFSFKSHKLKKRNQVVFNLADIAIFIGTFLMFLSSVLISVFESGSHKSAE